MSLSMPPNKSFKSDIEFFYKKLKYKENFSLSKFADGEWAVMKNVAINNKEFWFDPNDQNDQMLRNKLIESFKYVHKNYYVGISCPCCQGQEVFEEMLQFSNQNEDHLTWANIWVNGNYPYYIRNILPIYSSRPVVLYCHKDSKVSNLPFKPFYTFPIDRNAWKSNISMIEESKMLIDNEDLRDTLFLFCCGPFGNILCHELTKHNQNNTYLDIGSTLNPFLRSAGFERHYYLGDNFFSRMICTWGK